VNHHHSKERVNYYEKAEKGTPGGKSPGGGEERTHLRGIGYLKKTFHVKRVMEKLTTSGRER